MKKLMFLTMVFGLMMVFASVASAQNKGNGRVLTINNANNTKGSESAPAVGNDVVTSIVASNGAYAGLPKGMKYTQLELRQNGKIMYFYYAADTPQVQDQINNKRAKVSSVCTNTKPWKPEDKLTIQTQAAQGGGTDVTFTNQGKGCFSFIAK